MVAIVLLLQARSQVTVPRLAAELEVSERTVRRDLDALLAAGVPLYSQRGRGGGWALLEGHRINLSGLTAAEAQALFLVAGPQALSGLGLEAGARSALRKLLAALPAPVRDEAERASAAIHVDPERWSGYRDDAAPEALTVLREAVVAGRQVDLTYEKPGDRPAPRRVHPWGLVAKAGVWYLVAGTAAGPRTFRVSRVRAAVPTDDPAERPDGFDLARAWNQVRDRVAEHARPVTVELAVEPGAERAVAFGLGASIPVRSSAARPGAFSATFPSEWSAVAELARLGGRVRVISPDAVRERLAALGRDLVAAHGAPHRDATLPTNE